MVNRINYETLVYLDFTEYIENKTPMPKSSLDWIEKHGIPDGSSIVDKQKKAIGILTARENRAQEKVLHQTRIAKAVNKYGRESLQVIEACRRAKEAGIGWKDISKWSGITQYKIYNRLAPTKEYLAFKELFDKGLNKKSSEVIDLIVKLYKEGLSINKISCSSQLSCYSIKKIIKSKNL